MTNSGEPTLPPETSQTAASSPAWPTPRVFLPPTASTSAQPAVASSSTSSTPSSSASRIVPPVSNEDPKPTAEEIKAAYASTLERNQRAGIGPDAPLMTKAMREKHEAKFDKGKTKKTYQEVRVRFRLPDRTQLEYTLPSTSTQVLDLYPMLRSTAFSDSVPPFVLYTTPPRQDLLERDARLKGKKIGDMGWGGAAVVSLRWVEEGATSAEAKKLNRSDTAQPIRERLREKVERMEPPKMGLGDESGAATPAAPSSSSAGRTLGGGSGSGGQGEEKKIPKWFKGFKK